MDKYTTNNAINVLLNFLKEQSELDVMALIGEQINFSEDYPL